VEVPARGVGLAVGLALDAALASDRGPAAFRVRVWQITSEGREPRRGQPRS